MPIYNRVYLTPLKPQKSLRRERICTFDIETKDGLIGSEIFCWNFTYRTKGRYKNLKNISGCNGNFGEIFDFLGSYKDKTHYQMVYVHNLWFDYRHLEKYLNKINVESKFIRSGSNVICVIVDDFRVKFVDSFQYLLSSQEKAELGWDIPAKYRKIDCKHIFNKPYSFWSLSDMKKVLAHNINDTQALWLVIEKLRKSVFELMNVDICSTISASSLTLKAFRMQMFHDIKENLKNCEYLHGIENPFLYFSSGNKSKKFNLSYHIDYEKEEFVRKSYFGGRCEVFDKSEQTNLVYRDRNSMYPSEMKNQYYPIGQPKWVHEKGYLHDIIEGRVDKLGLIEAIIKPNEKDNYPLLPIRYNQKVMFTHTERQWIYTSVELQEAYKQNYEIKVIKGLIYPEKAKIFENYIDKLYQYRLTFDKKNHKGQNAMAKLFMNGLYGKFGQRMLMKQRDYKLFYDFRNAVSFMDLKREELEKELTPLEEKYGFEPYVKLKHYTDLGRYVVEFDEIRESKKPFQNITLATFTTAYARINLYQQMKLVESIGGKVYYCDTDSVAIDKEIAEQLPISKELGAWDNEAKFKTIKFLAPKAYLAYGVKSEIDSEFKMQPFLKLKGLDRAKINEILKSSQNMEEIEQQIRKRLVMAEKYCQYAQSHHYGEEVYSKINHKKFTFQSGKRRFISDSQSIAWNDRTIPKEYKAESML